MGLRILGLTSFFCSSSLNTSTFMSGSFTYLRLLRHLSFSSCFSSLYVNTSHVSNTLQFPSILRTAIGTCSSDRTATISIKDYCFRSTVASLDTKGDFIKTLPVDLSPAIKCSVENSSFYPNVSIIPFLYKRRIVFANQTSHFKLSLGRESGLCSPSIEDLSYAGHLSNPTQAFKKLKRLRFKQFSRLNLHLCGQSSGLQLSSYSSSSVSNSTRRRDSSTYPPRAANNACKTGSSRGRYYPPRTYAPSSANGSAPPAQELPFEYQYSYSEIPKVAPIGFREPPYSPFGPSTLPRPWTGRGPLQKSKKKGKEIDSFNPPPPGKKGVKPVDPPGPFLEGQAPKLARTREEILGEPLTKEEVNDLVESCNRENRQINLGRDGLTHNMLEVIHLHWKRRRSVKIRCKGVPTMDMDNVCFHLEDKTGGKIIHRIGGTVHLFRGRNYNTRFRPKIPLMLWKPAAPIYPRLIKRIPDGLTKEEAIEMQKRGRKVQPLCKLARNGVYLNLVKDVKEAFEVDELVRIDCKGMNPSDYKKIGAKLRDMVPCVLISFEREQILMWRGRDRKSVCPVNPEISAEKASVENTSKASTTSTTPEKGQERINEFGFPPSEFELLKENNLGAARTSANASEVDKLWQQALDDGVASLLDENGHAISLTEGSDIHVSATEDEPSTFTDQTASRLTNDKTMNFAGNSATSQEVLPVEELAKLLAS